MSAFKQRFRHLIYFILVSFIFQMLPVNVYALDNGVGDVHGGTPVGNAGPGGAGEDGKVPGENTPEGESPPAQNPAEGCPETNPVLITTGEWTKTVTDAVFPSRGMGVEITRTYRSQSEFNGRFGFGWFLNYHMRLKKLSSGNMLFFNGASSLKTEFVATDTPVYQSPKGYYMQLVDNGDGTHTLTQSDGMRYQFDMDGKLIAQIDRNNNQISFEYDGSGLISLVGLARYFVGQPEGIIAFDYKLIKIIDTVGRTIHLSYTADGRLSTITDYNGRIWRYAYENENLVSITQPATAQYPSGVTQYYTYDNKHNMTTFSNYRGQVVTTNRYDVKDRVYEQDYCGGTAYLSYDPTNKKTTVIDREGFVVDWKYLDGHITEKKVYTRGLRENEPAAYITKMTYNTHGEIVAETFPKGNGVKYTYDENNADPRRRGNLLTIRQKESMSVADNNTRDLVTTITYEPRFNLVKSMTDPKGNVYTNYFDYELLPDDPKYGTAGNIIRMKQPLAGGQTPEFNLTYNTFGQIAELEDPNQNVVTYDYFSDTGYLKEIIEDPDEIQARTQFSYDSYGNMNRFTDPSGYGTTYEYDAMNRLIRIVNPLNFITKYAYDADGNVTRVERQSGRSDTVFQTTQFSYTKFNKIETVIDPLSRQTTLSYDLRQSLKSVLDAEGNLTQYQYDERNLLLSKIDANTPAGVTSYAYDANGNIASIVDARNNTTRYEYDGFNRLTKTVYADGKFAAYVYDKNSNMSRYTNPALQIVDSVYDALNRITAKNFPANSGLNTSFVYDAGGRLVDANNAAAQIHFNYDALNRLKDTTQTVNTVAYPIVYSYDTAGNLTEMRYPSGKSIAYTYDENDRLVTLETDAQRTTYAYDSLDRRIYQSMKKPGGASQEAVFYQYDIANQLKTIINNHTGSGSTQLISRFDYPVYDQVRNRLQLNRTRGVNPLETFNYQYNDIYELTAVTGAQTKSYVYDNVGNRINAENREYIVNALNQYTQAGSMVLNYDNNGNLTGDGTRTYTYDELNRLKEMSIGTSTTTYQYDAFNRRVAKIVDGVKTVFVYDGNNVIAEYSDTGDLAAEYMYGDRIDEVLTMDRDGDRYYYHYDGLGSVTEVTDSSGMLVEYYVYDPYGNVEIFDESATSLGQASGIDNPYMFTGRRWDEESGTYYYRARQYDPQLGRFLQRDPLSYVDSMNLYQYVGNNSINKSDPMGLYETFPDWAENTYRDPRVNFQADHKQCGNDSNSINLDLNDIDYPFYLNIIEESISSGIVTHLMFPINIIDSAEKLNNNSDSLVPYFDMGVEVIGTTGWYFRPVQLLVVSYVLGKQIAYTANDFGFFDWLVGAPDLKMDGWGYTNWKVGY